MNNKKGTKRALLTSVMALAMCVVMLIGTTFAWFTDTATANVNTIKSGKLQVELQKKVNDQWVDAEGSTLNFVKSSLAQAGEELLWEPGCTYELEPVRIVNKGNLALKYKVQITGIEQNRTAVPGQPNLNDVIEWTITYGSSTNTVEGSADEYFLLPANTEGEALTISGHMKESAGNDYQDLTIDGAVITVYATQYTSEFDSSTDQYDKDATYYPVLNAAGLKDALVNGGNIQLDADVTADATMVANKTTTIDMNGKTIGNTTEIWSDDNGTWSLLSAQGAGTNLTITGDGTFQAKDGDCFALDVQDGATVTIKNGEFVGNIHAVYVLQGTAIIEGGFFSVQQKYPEAGKENEFVLNCYDANRAAGTAKIIVKGGTFVNFNPADCKAEGEHTNFVAPGYSVITETHGTDTWYTVVKGDVTTLTPETVNNSGIYHSNKTYFLSAGEYGDFTATLEQSYKNVTFLASENAKFAKVTIQYHGGEPSDDVIGTKGDSTLTVKGFHVSGGISISSFDKNVTVEENDATFISLKTNHVADMGVQFLNNKLGVGTVEKGYGIYFVPNTTNYDLTITGNTFTGAKSHAIAVQGNGDGRAVTAAKSITVTGNNFVSYGLNGESNRAAFKIWADTALTPDPNKANDAANALANAIKTSNTFGTLGANCVVAQFDKANVAFN